MDSYQPITNGRKRDPLAGQWSMCATVPGEGQSITSDALPWVPLARLTTAAAALRDLKQWSIDDSARRFDAQDWWYRLKFDSPACQPGQRLVLRFDGLATLAQVWLNGVELLTSDNMFVSHECEVDGLLHRTGNELLICCRSLDAELAVRRARPRWRAPMVEHQQLRWFRTTLLGRTPGWSPPAAVVGPWKDIWLEARDGIDIKTCRISARVEGNSGVVTCHTQVQANSGQVIESAQLTITRGKQVHCAALSCTPGANQATICTGEFRLSDVALWWPHTHGEPCLYEAALEFRISGQADAILIDMGRVGFRTISLDSSDGEFSICVNGIPVFCRGACWTPLDPVTLRSTPADCRAAIAQACAAGMNMLRVAGTMVYEEDHFFDACDEQGMLVWQDFMFANMDYPIDDPAFIASVQVEVTQQLQRMQARACLALLCGNSEVAQQAAMWGSGRDLWRSTFFDGMLARLCADLAPDTPYWPSSSHGGSFPHQANHGTTSYYGVGAYLRPLEDARLSEVTFAAECLAFSNIPADSTLARMPGGMATRVHHPAWKSRTPRDLNAGWDFDDVRDHYLGSVFQLDPLQLRYSDHHRYLHLGRAATGEAMAACFTEWRRPGSPCRGGIVLHWRDLWAGAGWGLTDDHGRPKACYHYLKRVLQPQTVLLSDEGLNGLQVHVLNERSVDASVELSVSLWRDGEVEIASAKKVLTVPAHGKQSAACLDLFEFFMDLSHAYRFGPKVCDAVVATLKNFEGQKIAETFYFPGGLRDHQENDIGLTAEATMMGAQTALLTVGTTRLAQGVHIDTPGFQADDDYFNLAPGSQTCILLHRTSGHTLMGSASALNCIKTARIRVLDGIPRQSNLEQVA